MFQYAQYDKMTVLSEFSDGLGGDIGNCSSTEGYQEIYSITQKTDCGKNFLLV
jgi:hypothetical protein